MIVSPAPLTRPTSAAAIEFTTTDMGTYAHDSSGRAWASLDAEDGIVLIHCWGGGPDAGSCVLWSSADTLDKAKQQIIAAILSGDLLRRNEEHQPQDPSPAPFGHCDLCRQKKDSVHWANALHEGMHEDDQFNYQICDDCEQRESDKAHMAEDANYAIVQQDILASQEFDVNGIVQQLQALGYSAQVDGGFYSPDNLTVKLDDGSYWIFGQGVDCECGADYCLVAVHWTGDDTVVGWSHLEQDREYVEQITARING